MGQSTLIALSMRLTTLAFVLTVLVVAQAEAKPKAKPQTVKAQIHIGINTDSDNTGTMESRDMPPAFLEVKGWIDCMKNMGIKEGFCLPAKKPTMHKCLDESWKELHKPDMGTIPCDDEQERFPDGK